LKIELLVRNYYISQVIKKVEYIFQIGHEDIYGNKNMLDAVCLHL